MALYTYQALSKDGTRKGGAVDAPSEQAVKDQLVRQGLYPISVQLSKEASEGFSFRQLFERSVTQKEKILFTKQLAVLLKSGIPLLQALELLVEQFDGRMKRIVISLKDSLKEGGTLAQALGNYPRVFENIYIQLVRAGEASGKLESILERLTQYLERREILQKRIKAALRQPLFQLGIIGVVTVILLAFVVPNIAKLFEKSGSMLPLPTRIILALSTAVQKYYILVIIAGVILFIVYKYWSSTVAGKRTLDVIKLRIPIFGYFARMRAVAEFCSTLGMLLEGGVHLAEALDIVCSIVDNQILADTLREAREKIIKEGKITQYLKQTKVFPPMAIYLIKTGEESGQLDQMLLVVARNYEDDLRELADALTAQLEPLMTIFTAIVVGFIVMAVAIPLVKISSAVGGGGF
jgi:type II secretory pathway component PulF